MCARLRNVQDHSVVTIRYEERQNDGSRTLWSNVNGERTLLSCGQFRDERGGWPQNQNVIPCTTIRIHSAHSVPEVSNPNAWHSRYSGSKK